MNVHKMNILDDKLEDMIDADGLASVLEALARVCSAKADHIRSIYGDPDITADAWDERCAALLNLTAQCWRHGLRR